MQKIERIDLLPLVLALLRRWWLIAFCGLVMGGVAYVYTDNFITPMYRASVSIYVNNVSESVTSSSEYYISSSNLATSQRLVTTYVNIITSNRVLSKVVEQSGLDLTVTKVRGMMSASAVDDTEMFNIYVTSSDPQLAAQVANAVAAVAPDEIADILEGSSTKIIDYAEVPTSRYSPSYRTNTFYGFLVGAVLAAAYVILITLLDKRIKSEEDLEQRFELPVLGVIPSFDTGHKKNGKYGYAYASKAAKEESAK